MAFHGRSNRASRNKRESSRESVLGLAGWLFADLLLALSVVFLVAQDRPSQETDKDKIIADLQKIVAEKNSLLDSIQNRVNELEEICKENSCDKASGLTPGEQLIIEIPKGASGVLNVAQMTAALDGATLTIEQVGEREKRQVPTSWSQLKRDNRRIGFVILYTRNIPSVQDRAAKNLGAFVHVLVDKGLVDPKLQLEANGSEYRYDVFPSLKNYEDRTIDSVNKLKIRALMFTYTSPVTSSTTTIAD